MTAINIHLSIITLNINSLDSLIKGHRLSTENLSSL